METAPFVGRQREIERLHGYLARAADGAGQLCFITGEAGSGKTTLVEEFVRQAQAGQPRLLAAVGRCDAHTGAGDAYLPFREILGLLTGTVDPGQGKTTRENAGRLGSAFRVVIDLLVEIGPDLVGTVLPPIKLATKAGLYIAEKAGWVDKLKLRMPGKPGAGKVELDQEHLFEQYTNVLRKLAEKHPLIVVVDDLQWADDASTHLLFRLGRRLEGSRILLIGTYRPEEVALGRAGAAHPLEKVLVELKRYEGDIWIDLEQSRAAEGRAFVDALLDAEPNRLDGAFRQSLYQHTAGHPLFVVEIVRALQERGDLVAGPQGWEVGPGLDWARLPTRVEGVLEERLGRLDAATRRMLAVASVEGEVFTAEVLARLLALPERDVVRQLSEHVAGQHRLVSAVGLERRRLVRLSRFQFRYTLLQEHLYGGIGEAERSYLHEDIGHALEGLYGEGADEIAVQLAYHFEQAQDMERARHYLQRAGESAAAAFANAEALGYLGRALALAPTGDRAARWELLLAREKVYHLLGDRQHQREDLAALEEMAGTQGDPLQRAEVALRWAGYCDAVSNYPAVLTAAGRAIEESERAGDVPRRISGLLVGAQALWRQGRCEEALPRAAEALQLARQQGSRAAEGKSLHQLGTIHYGRADYAAARDCLEQSLAIHRALDDRRGTATSFSNLAGVCMALGDYGQARLYCEQALVTFQAIGDRRNETANRGNLGAIAYALGELEAARDHLEAALPQYQAIGDRRGTAIAAKNLALVLHDLGDDPAARAYCQQALQIERAAAIRRGEGYTLTALGLIQEGLREWAAADSSYAEALRLRQELGQHGAAVDDMAGLARVALQQGQLERAQEWIRQALEWIAAHGVEGVEYPVRVYLTGYRVRQAAQDPAAGEALAAASRLLQERAACISDEALRRSFLERLPLHREVLRLYGGGGPRSSFPA